MRFAYIDSQGKEVGIPSVEALGLRIELGAITPSTQLYDAAADRWAPASEHEVFRTLSREIQEKGEGGFVAPPPPTRAATEPAAPEAPEKRRAPNPFEMIEGPGEEPTEPEEAQPEEPAGPPAAEPPQPAAAPTAEEPGDEGFDFGLDLTLAEVEEPEASGEPQAPEEAEEGPRTVPGMEALEVESSAIEQEEGASAVFSGESLELEDMLSTSYGADEEAEPGPEGPGGREPAGRGPVSLWDDHGDDDAGDEPSPAWTRAEDEAMRPPPADPEAEEARLRAQAEERRAAARARFDDGGEAVQGASPRTADDRRRARPSTPPPARRSRSGVPAGLVGGVLLLVVAGAGWFGWSLFQEGRAEAEVEEPMVAVPQIPAEMEPRFRELAAVALEGTLAELRSLQEERDLAEAPPPRWLSGEYMANAGSFAEVGAYFGALQGWLDAVRASDSTAFETAFTAALDGVEVEPDEAELLRRRALAGFSAAGRERRRAYQDFQAVLDATTSLHGFLLENESQIDYEPAAGGMSRDPVLEAVPASPAIGDEMWDRVDRITEALDELGALDQVTTDRLVAVLLSRVEAAGVR